MEQTFWEQYGDWISAAITIVGALVIAYGVDRFVIGRGTEVATRFTDSSVSRVTVTRLRVVRRLVFLLIVFIGIALALTQIDGVKRLATGLLASSALLGLIVGLAARQSVANFVAGIMIATTQPIRIGDRITFDETTGRVENITLAYTFLDPGDGRLMVIPNEHIVGSEIFNHSTGNLGAPILVWIWLPPGADVGAARRALDGIAESVQVSELTHEGVKLELRQNIEGDRTRVGGEEAALREKSHSALREAGLLDFT
ncbi:MAG: mechanosensitive ion channel family protein [Solirubrobacterales bacterium]